MKINGSGMSLFKGSETIDLPLAFSCLTADNVKTTACSSEIDIASVIRLLVTAQQGVSDQLRADYNALPARASDCAECGECMERCPFGVDVISKMKETVELFESGTRWNDDIH